MSEVSGQLKQADLRACFGSVEGLCPLEGEVRNMGISEGFTGQGMGACSCGGGFVPQRGPVSKKFAEFLFGESFSIK